MRPFGWFRADPELRAITSLPFDVGATTSAGSPRTPTVERAVRLAPVYAAGRHIADTGATLPLAAYRRQGANRDRLENLPGLLRGLELDGRLEPWLTTCLLSLALKGNTVGLITSFDGNGTPASVVWIPLEHVAVDDTNPADPVWRIGGRPVARQRIVHIPWLTVPGRTLGLSPLAALAFAVGIGLDSEQYALDWYRAGGIPPGTFKNSNQRVDQEKAEAVKGRLVAAIRTRAPLVYGRDWDYNPITIAPAEAAFVDASKMSANQIAAVYGIDPTEVGGEAANSLTYANEEHRQTNRLHNLRPYLVRVERAISRLLPERTEVKFNIDGVVRADIKSRHEVFKIDREIGLRSINELRALEDLPPVEGGDTYAPTSATTANQQEVRNHDHY